MKTHHGKNPIPYLYPINFIRRQWEIKDGFGFDDPEVEEEEKDHETFILGTSMWFWSVS